MARGLRCRLVVVGGRRPGRVWADPPELPEGAPVVSLGPVDDGTLQALYTGSAVLGHPALAEGFGRPPLEAMACGAPVLAALYGPAQEVLGDAAEIVPLDIDAWMATLEGLLTEPADLSKASSLRFSSSFLDVHPMILSHRRGLHWRSTTRAAIPSLSGWTAPGSEAVGQWLPSRP